MEGSKPPPRAWYTKPKKHGDGKCERTVKLVKVVRLLRWGVHLQFKVPATYLMNWMWMMMTIVDVVWQ